MKYSFIRILVALTGMVLLSACGGGGGGSSNHAPIATDQTVSTAEDTAKVVTLDGTDAEGDSLSYAIVSNPAHGTLSGTAPHLTYTPETNFNGSDSFTFTINDGTVDSNVSTVDITVSAVNDTPTASDFSLVLDVDKSFVTADWKALSSAEDAEGDALSASASDGTHGSCMIFAMMDGSTNLLYLPTFDAPIEDHVDHCTVTITDAQGAETTISVGIDILYWKQLSSKADFTIALKSDGTVWGWGSNRYGQLGDGTTIDRDHPIQESTHADDWIQVAAGYTHAVAIKSDGTLRSWGANHLGQLGNRSNTNSVSPVQESTHSTHWVKVVADNGFTVAKTSDETLYAWGDNFRGQLGIDAAGDRNEPTSVDGGSSGWSDIAAGNGHVIALKTNGELWSWGNNYYGQLGNNESRNSHPAPVRVATTDSDWKSISCGNGSSFAIKNNGTLYAWGYNNEAQLGLGDTNERKTPEQVGTDTWSKVSGGLYHSLGAKSNGTLWVWGRNYYSQLGDDDTIFRESEPYQVGTENDWSQVTASGMTSIAINSSGTLYGWGYNTFGQLGNKKTDTQYTPLHTLSDKTWKQISVGRGHTLAIDQDSKLWAWGDNYYGKLGIGSDDVAPIYAPAAVDDSSTWSSVATGSIVSVGLKTDGTLWIWGSNLFGQLGLGDNSIHSKNTPQQVGISTWKSICVGQDHVAAIRSDDKLFIWGLNSDGQLGIGNTIDQNQPTQEATHGSWRQISCGDYHMAGIRTNHGLWTWGKNSGGSLGLGDTNPRNEPQQITGSWVMVAAGRNHTLAIKSGDTLWGWGTNYLGQVGNGAYTQATSPVQIGTDSPWGIVAAGGDTSMAMRGSDDTVWVWGDNTSSQFGREGREVRKANQPQEIASLRGTTATTNVSLSVSPYSIGLVKNDGTLWTWGTNDHKRLARDWYTKTPNKLIERHAP